MPTSVFTNSTYIPMKVKTQYTVQFIFLFERRTSEIYSIKISPITAFLYKRHLISLLFLS